MKCALMFLLVTLISAANVFPQSMGKWTYYTDSNSSLAVACDGDYVWNATFGGMVRWNTVDSTYVKYITPDLVFMDNVWYILSVLVDSRKRIWECSVGGLSCFDGVRWNSYPRPNAVGGVYGGLTCMTIDREDVVWCGLPDGLARFNGTDWSYYPVDVTYEHFFIGSIAIDFNGVVWCATLENGLFSFDGKNWKRHSTEDGLLDDNLRRVAVDNEGILWVLCSNGVQCLDNGEWQTFSGKSFFNVFVDTYNVKWFTGPAENSLSGELISYDGELWLSHPVPENSRCLYQPFSFAVDRRGILWHTMELCSVDGNVEKAYKTFDGPADNNIHSIAVDHDNVKWFGTRLGISRFDGRTWRSWNSHQFGGTMPDNGDVCEIVVDHRNRKWSRSLSGTGVTSFDDYEFMQYTVADGLADNRVSALAVDSTDVKWFGHERKVSAFDGSSWTVCTVPDSLDRIESIAVDRDNVKWFGARNGWAASFDGNAWKIWKVGNYPCYLAIHGNTKWFSCGDKLVRNEGNSWLSFPVQYDDMPVLAGRATVDRNGWIWCICGSSGVICFDGTSWRQYREKDGLLDYYVCCGAVDRENIKWFGTHCGICSLESDFPTQVTTGSTSSGVSALSFHPNPFNPSTTITFTLPASGRAEVAVYDITGRNVRDLVTGHLPAGEHSVVWDGRDGIGRAVATGVYFSRLRFLGRTVTGKMLLVR